MIYISGRISGNKNWKRDFLLAEAFLTSSGYDRKEIINPLWMEEVVTKEKEYPKYRDFMETDIRMLIKCDEIFMLKGWWRSKGAKLEHHIAKTLGMRVIYE